MKRQRFCRTGRNDGETGERIPYRYKKLTPQGNDDTMRLVSI